MAAVVERDPIGVRLVDLFQTHALAIQHLLTFNRIEGDGNCQFRAGARGDIRYGEQEYKRLRMECVDYVETNPDEFKDSLPDDVTERTPQMMAQWAALMREDREYGDNLTLLAAAQVLQRPIVILDYHGDQPPRPLIPRPWPRVTFANPIYVQHQRRGTKQHYDLFTSKNIAATCVVVPEVDDNGLDPLVAELDLTLSDDDGNGDGPGDMGGAASSSKTPPKK
jgi:hypothetical protein